MRVSKRNRGSWIGFGLAGIKALQPLHHGLKRHRFARLCVDDVDAEGQAAAEEELSFAPLFEAPQQQDVLAQAHGQAEAFIGVAVEEAL